MKWFWALALSLTLVACGDSDPERVCDGQRGDCSCDAPSEGWCIQYHSDGGTLPEGDCEEYGGKEVKETCPTANRAGWCQEVDDCHDPAYLFYNDYAGGLLGYADIPAARAACEAGDIVGGTCAQWFE